MAGEREKSRVPALGKGLDILEALASEQRGLSQKEVAERVGRTVSEVFRVLGELETRGYIARDAETGAYALTLRLFELAHQHPPTKRLIGVATGKMQLLANRIGVSCHLVTRRQDKLMVIAQALPDSTLMGWSVKVGAVFPCAHTYASARTIVAHQLPEYRTGLIADLTRGESDAARQRLTAQLDEIRRQGVEISRSAIAPGVTDVSCPILNHLGVAVAALTVPTIDSLVSDDLRESRVAPTVKSVAEEISRAIGGGAPSVMPAG
jgi:DNA-binding IclR family transcriptional regulator